MDTYQILTLLFLGGNFLNALRNQPCWFCLFRRSERDYGYKACAYVIKNKEGFYYEKEIDVCCYDAAFAGCTRCPGEGFRRFETKA